MMQFYLRPERSIEDKALCLYCLCCLPGCICLDLITITLISVFAGDLDLIPVRKWLL